MKSVGMLSVFFLICSILGCSHKTEEALAAVTRERDEYKQALAKGQEQIIQLQSENQQLKQTARFYFDQATNEMNAAVTTNTDVADRAVIAKFQEVVNRFPDDILAGVAAEKIKNLEKRISERDLAIERAQSEVMRLVKSCHDATIEVQRISGNNNDDLMVNRFNQLDVNWNVILARDREAKPYQQTASKAKERAQSLLQNVPDPDGSLGRKVETCDSTNE